MKTDTMRIIDRLVGTPLCKLLSGLAPVLGRAPKGEVVVLCKFFGLGSICLSYPLISELKRHGKEIVFLTFSANRPMVKALGVERCISIDPSSGFRFARDVLKAIAALRNCRPSVFLNLEFFSRFAAILSVLSGAGCRAGFHMLHLPVGDMYTHRTNLNVYRNVAENYLNVGEVSGIIKSPGSLEKSIDQFPYKPERPVIPDITGPYMVLNAESSETIQELRSWPAASWGQLISRLRTRFSDFQLVLIGTEQGRGIYENILKSVAGDAKVIDCIGKTSFDEFAGLLAHAEIVISVDSGPFHLSAFLKRKTIGLFGPETPVLYGYALPWVSAIYRNLMCSPCLAIYDAKKSVLDCQDNQCLKQISVDQVYDEIERLLSTA
jgi:heptosyltransferase III